MAKYKLWIKEKYSAIKRLCENHKINIFESKVSEMMNNNGKDHQSIAFRGEKLPNEYMSWLLSHAKYSKSTVTMETLE